MALVNLINSSEMFLEAIIDFLVWTFSFIDYTDRQEYHISLRMSHYLILHLIPNGIRTLHTCFRISYSKSHIIQELLTDWSGKLLKKSIR